MFENFRGGRGMKLSFGRGDIDIGFFLTKKHFSFEKAIQIHAHTYTIYSFNGQV